MGFGTKAVKAAGRAVLAADKRLTKDKRWGARDMSGLAPVTRVGEYGKPCRSCKGLGDMVIGKQLATCSKCGGTGRR
jgi:hypothetical protein